MDGSMFHISRSVKVAFWVGLFLMILLIFTAGVAVGRASVHWGRPIITWTKE